MIIILICGLPGTGKTLAAVKLAKALPEFLWIDQTQVRRQFGEKIIPTKDQCRDLKNRDLVPREIDKMIGRAMRSGQSVIFESANRFSSRRNKVYGIASCHDAQVLVLEAVCPEEVSKARMTRRSKGDELLSDPNDPAVYDRMKKGWQEVMGDFKDEELSYVSYVKYDSHENKLNVIFERDEVRDWVSKIRDILTPK